MPYISQAERDELKSGDGYTALTAGKVNYLISREIDIELTIHGVSYSELNAIIGDLDVLKIRFAVGNTSAGHGDSPLLVWMTWLINTWLNQDQLVSTRDAVGVLSCIREELYRRVVAPYEDSKCFTNGDVYTNTWFN